jgi:hypothetical protein
VIDERNNQVVFSVTVGMLQEEAINRIGRKLTDAELDTASNGIEAGLSTGIDIILETAVEEAVRIS